MASNVWIQVVSNKNDGQDDLANGAGGDFRYLDVSHEMHVDE